MAVTKVNDAPGADIFQQFYNSHNGNADEIIVSVSATPTATGIDVVFTKFGGGTFTVSLPASEDKILSGLSTTIVGAGPYSIDYTSGNYQINGANYSIGAGSQAIPVADPTLPRIDALVVDTGGASAYITGTPAANPASPTIGATQLLVGLITVPSQASGSPPGGGGPSLTLPSGFYNGAILRWNGTDWESTSNFLQQIWTDNDFRANVDNSFSLRRNDGGTGGGSGIDMQAAQTQLIHRQGAADFLIYRLESGLSVVEQTSSTEVEHFFDIDGGVKLKRAVPSVTADKLYCDLSGNLFWNGLEVCLAPCGGGPGLALPSGTTTGEIIFWNQGTAQWEIAPSVIIYAANFEATRDVIELTGGPVGAQTILLADTNGFDVNYSNGLLTANNDLILNLSGLSFNQVGAAEASFILDADGGMHIVRDGAPSNTVNRLYHIGGVLYFNGSPVDTTSGLPGGTANGQMLRWNNTAAVYEIANGTLNTLDRFWAEKNSAASAPSGIRSTNGTTNQSAITIDTFNAMMYSRDLSGNGTAISVNAGKMTLQNTGSTLATLVLDFGGGIRIIHNGAPATTTNRLYRIGGVLYWNGAPLTGGGLPAGNNLDSLYYDGISGLWLNTNILQLDPTNNRVEIDDSTFTASKTEGTTDALLRVDSSGPLGAFIEGVSTDSNTGESTKFENEYDSFIVSYTDGGTQTANATVGGNNKYISFLTSDTSANQNSSVIIRDSDVRISYNDTSTPRETELRVLDEEVRIREDATTDTFLNVDVGGGIRVKDAVPSITADRIHNDAQRLHFNDEKLELVAKKTGTSGVLNVLASDLETCSEYRIFVTTGATINLPASPPDNSKVIVKETDGLGSGHTINGGGNNIDGAASYAIPASAYAGVEMVFDSINSAWFITSKV